jgi:hypothetical protein
MLHSQGPDACCLLPSTRHLPLPQYYLKMQPQLFQSAVEQQLQRLKEEKEAKEAADEALKSQEESDAEAGTSPTPQRSSSELVLRQRMEEVRALEVQATLEDLMYVSILEKFVVLGVEMLPRMDGESAGAGQLPLTPVPAPRLPNAQQSWAITGSSMPPLFLQLEWPSLRLPRHAITTMMSAPPNP